MSVAVRRALYGKLAGDSTLTALLGAPPTGKTQNIYHAKAPTGAAFPLVIFFKSDGRPIYALGRRALEDEVWTIKGVSRGPDADAVDAIATRLDALLTDGTISISGSAERYLRRGMDMEYEETIDGVPYLHAGAQFRLVHEPT